MTLFLSNEPPRVAFNPDQSHSPMTNVEPERRFRGLFLWVTAAGGLSSFCDLAYEDKALSATRLASQPYQRHREASRLP